ncbi:MAG TPA: amino acid ABC transporter permease [Pseudolabrys sp.]|nr:amino acid ABC transporter permease [Pseudolabrys sp.]
MNEFAVVWQHRDLIINGFGNTLIIVALSATGALVLGALLTIPLMSRNGAVRRIATAYVDVMRCVPFLLFVYLLYFGFPSLGLRFDNWTAGIIALTLYNTAYMGEVLRATWAGLPKELIEAGHAFGFSGLRLFRRIILPPVLYASLPLIGNQLIQVVKDSAFLTIIAVAELTHEATSLQTTYFVPFASFVAAVLLYWVTCVCIESTIGYANRYAEERR